MPNTKETLIAARELIAEPERWTKGRAMEVAEDGSVRYCASGALSAAGGHHNEVIENCSACAAADVLTSVLPRRLGVSGFNDLESTTHADVLAAFDRAIEAA